MRWKSHMGIGKAKWYAVFEHYLPQSKDNIER